jgi:tight adherence protein C
MKFAQILSLQVTAFFATALVFVWFMTRPTSAAKRILGMARLRPASAETRRSGSGRVQGPLLRGAHFLGAWLGIAKGEKLRKRFLAAGLRNQSSIDAYVAARLLAPIAVLVIWSFFHQVTFFWITVMLGGTYLAPDMWLKRVIKKRREQIRLGLPDAVDLMVVCVDAGLGLDQALLRTGEELGTSHAVLAEELTQINLEQRAGKPRVDAWRDMADRTQLESVKGFASMLGQADRFGTPISKALSIFADGLRKQRSQQAEEIAAKSTVKLMFPLVLCIFPSMFIVLLGPAALLMSRNLGALGGK